MVSVPPQTPSMPPPPPRPSALSRLSPTRLTQSFGIGLVRDIFGSMGARSNAVIVLPLLPLLPSLSALGLLFYQRGQEKAKGNDPNPKTAQMLTSLSLAFLMATQAKGVYSAFALVKTLYDMGTQDNAMQKWRSVIQNLGVFISAYIGFKAGFVVNEAIRQADDSALHRLLHKEPDIGHWISNNYQQPGARGELAQNLQLLKERLAQLKTYQNDPASSKEFRDKWVKDIRQYSSSILHTPENGVVQEFTERTSPKALQRIAEVLEHANSVGIRTAKFLNPAAFGLLFTTFVGVPIIRSANRWLERKHPELHDKQGEFFRFPELANTPGNYHGPGNLNAQQRGKTPHESLIKNHTLGDGDMEMVPVTVPDMNVVV